ncbi:MAG: ribosomal protein S18-alanine N-acetyltransferase [Candidatus Rokuibacteriota bacterium]
MREERPAAAPVSAEAVTLEPMTLEDLDEVLAIERASFQTPWSRGAFRYELTQNRVARCLVARRGRRLVGYLCLWEIGHEIHVTNLAAHPDLRRRGVARALLGAVLDDAKERAVTLAFLEVRPTNTEALGLYERFGFRVIGRRKGYYFDTGEDALVMEARLSGEPSESVGPRRPGA